MLFQCHCQQHYYTIIFIGIVMAIQRLFSTEMMVQMEIQHYINIVCD